TPRTRSSPTCSRPRTRRSSTRSSAWCVSTDSRRSMMSTLTVLSLCLALGADVHVQPRRAARHDERSGEVLAGESQKGEARRSASADALVEIETPAGSIRVVGWDRGEVMVNGQLGAGATGLDFTGSGSRIRVGVDTERNPHGVVSALEVHVPARSRLQIE